MKIVSVDPEQSLVEWGARNVEQYDLKAYYDTLTVASLYRDANDNWIVVTRINEPKAHYLDDEFHSGDNVMQDFVDIVSEYLTDEMKFFGELANMIDELEVPEYEDRDID